jgi:exodeoxyribonuclease VII small subunit
MMATDDRDSPSETDGPGVETMSYTAASQELDEIVHFFEQREVDVDQLVARLVRATAIVEELDKRLRRTRVQVDQLVPKLAAVLSDAPEPDAPDHPRGADADVDIHAQDFTTSRPVDASRPATETPELF